MVNEIDYEYDENDIYHVCDRGDLERFKALIINDPIEYNLIDDLLEISIRQDHIDIVDYIINNYNQYIKESKFEDHFKDAYECKNNNILKLLLTKFNEKINKTDILIDLVENEEIEMIEYLLNNFTLDCNYTLITACNTSNSEMVDYLLTKKNINININEQDFDGNTPLIIASTDREDDITQMLLENANIDVNIQNKKGYTCLMLYCDNEDENEDIIDLILDKNVNINLKNEDGNTALLIACENGCSDIVEKLLDIDEIDINASNNKGNTPLIYCILNDDFKSIKRLAKKKKLNYNHQNNNGDTALMIACKKNNVKIINYLLDKTDLTILNKNGENILFYLSATNTKIMEKCIPAFHNINIQNNKGQTLLMKACEGNNLNSVIFLLKKSNIYLKDNNGKDAFYYIINNNDPNLQIIELFLNMNINIKNILIDNINNITDFRNSNNRLKMLNILLNDLRVDLTRINVNIPSFVRTYPEMYKNKHDRLLCLCADGKKFKINKNKIIII